MVAALTPVISTLSQNKSCVRTQHQITFEISNFALNTLSFCGVRSKVDKIHFVQPSPCFDCPRWKHWNVRSMMTITVITTNLLSVTTTYSLTNGGCRHPQFHPSNKPWLALLQGCLHAFSSRNNIDAILAYSLTVVILTLNLTVKTWF